MLRRPVVPSMSLVRRFGRGLAVLLVLALLAAPALAHVPAFGADNDSPGSATVVTNPTKSWAFYDSVTAGGAAYYQATYLDGERLYVSLYTPNPSLTPSLVVLMPGGEVAGDVPAAVEVPEGYGATVIEGESTDAAEFEPFTPGAYFYTVQVDRDVQDGGTYLFAVYEPGGTAGPVGMAVGDTEQFTPAEFLTVPLDVLAVHAWEGDSPLFVFGPGVVVALAGAALLRRRLADRDAPLTRWALGLAALAILGTSAMLATQLAVALAMTGPTAAAVLTLVLVVLPGMLATYLWRVATAADLALTRRRRAGLAVAGIGSLLSWGGLLLAPLVPLGLAVLPARAVR